MSSQLAESPGNYARAKRELEINSAAQPVNRGRLRLFHRHALREIPRLVDVGALQDRDMIGEELQRDGVDGGRLEVGQGLRRPDAGAAAARLRACPRVGNTMSSPPRARTSI